ncbi:hypothetical protein IGI04_029285 [Brassica rapa subsp. trilocularis]|uniref:TAFII55 protein conserved region domain-containing protein n=1 Tax=Brassica rapa subsp. trilocularis TaxID=1813537 RepID=A0ABQ7LMI4_BRACM|nr:hypothetical protein IGI04_029285 [Brassica rapa subsp. trilocularis]
MEEEFILRVLPSEETSTSDEIPLDLCFSVDRRSGTFVIGNEEFPASLLDHPAVVESFKTYDDSALLKKLLILAREPGDPAPNTVEYTLWRPSFLFSSKPKPGTFTVWWRPWLPCTSKHKFQYVGVNIQICI